MHRFPLKMHRRQDRRTGVHETACRPEKDLSHVLLREGEQVTVEYRIAQKLSAPVKKGSCAGAIYYKLGGMVLREYQVETTEDMEKLDFEWCLRQVLKLAV